MFKYKSLLIILLLFLFVTGCDGLKMPKSIFETSERAKYERSFSGSDSLMSGWKKSFSSAKVNHLKIKDGSSLTVFNSSSEALGYSIELEKGDLLIIETDLDNSDKKIFVDLLDHNTKAETTKTDLITNNRFLKNIDHTGTYKIILQPEIDNAATFKIKIYTQPSLYFPVAGKGNKNVQSFWGASRDGGGRSHEGVDIFAPRGTPVVAVAEGYITRTGNHGLGGKQVWLRDNAIGNSHYYAHLDSVLTQSGNRVKVGDTLGLVGNTGNAAGGATHLHFGIYSTGGAVNPYPYIRQRAVPKFIGESSFEKMSGRFAKAGTHIRAGSGTQYEILSTIDQKTQVKILASDGLWSHVKLSDGREGFISEGRLE